MSTSKAIMDPARRRTPGAGSSRDPAPVFAFDGDMLRLPTPQESVRHIREGFEFSTVHELADHLGVGDSSVLAVIGVSGGTIARRRQEKVLKPEESDRLYRVAKIAEKAERVLESAPKAKTWLMRENRALGGVTPFSILDTQAGADAVEDALDRIEYGVFG